MELETSFKKYLMEEDMWFIKHQYNKIVKYDDDVEVLFFDMLIFN
jgi:hypothetical protein